MIGIFDSGFGGLYTLKIFKKILPQYDYIFFADSKNAPYGDKDLDEVKKLTFDGLKYLFDNGAEIVILACNTASAAAIRDWQKTYPNKKVLSVTIPGIEKIIDLKLHNVGILATRLTVDSNIFPNKYSEICGGETQFHQIAATNLVRYIEDGDINSPEFMSELARYISLFPHEIEAIILGCTHYPIIAHHISRLLPDKIIIDPSIESAYRLIKYLDIHIQIKSNLSVGNKVCIHNSGDIDKFYRLAEVLKINF